MLELGRLESNKQQLYLRQDRGRNGRCTSQKSNGKRFEIMEELTLTLYRWDSLIMAEDFKVTKLIEHPEQQAPSGEAPAPEAIGLYLTKKERKKMRRLNRKEVQKEEQEKIRLGLLPAPEPKVLKSRKKLRTLSFI